MDLSLASWDEIIRELEERYDTVVVTVCSKSTSGQAVCRRSGWRGNCFTAYGMLAAMQREVEAYIDDPDSDAPPDPEMN